MAALLVGAALAMAGATYQNLFRNPLVSPGVLGVSFGAALGIILELSGQGLIALLKVVADPLNHLPTITFWLLGGLHRVTAPTLLAAAWPIGAAGEELLP